MHHGEVHLVGPDPMVGSDDPRPAPFQEGGCEALPERP